MIDLKGGQQSQDPRLDRVVQFDERSRNYPIRTLLEPKKGLPLRSYTWAKGVQLNQGKEGACVGFGHSGVSSAAPRAWRGVNDTFARNVYYEARKNDEWPGESYEGTSVLAGAKVMRRLGRYKEYRWAFNIDEVLNWLGYGGCVVFGLNFYESMMYTRTSGLMDVAGEYYGGHCFYARGLSLNPQRVLPNDNPGEPVVRCVNSWGTGWGLYGEFFLRVSHLEWLLGEQGEAMIPIENRPV